MGAIIALVFALIASLTMYCIVKQRQQRKVEILALGDFSDINLPETVENPWVLEFSKGARVHRIHTDKSTVDWFNEQPRALRRQIERDLLAGKDTFIRDTCYKLNVINR